VNVDWNTLIKAQPALAQIPAQLGTHAKLMEVDAGQVLFRTGSRVKNMVAVISGEARLVRRSRTGSEVILQRSRGGFIAEASLASKSYHCDLVAAEKGAVSLFPVEAFRATLAEDLAFQHSWMSHLACEVSKLRTNCERLSLNGAADRVLHYLESVGTDGTIVLTQSRKAWASELGLTHEALYRTLARLQSAGTLHIDGNTITLARRW
jgi:CRP-like cAMP-binding protein